MPPGSLPRLLRPLRLLHRFTVSFAVAAAGTAVLALGAPGPSPGEGPSAADSPPTRYVVPDTGTAVPGPDLRPVSHRTKHPHRKIKKYRVRPGDTPSGLAVRYHAWTDELIRMNHGSVLYAGRVIRIPVVVKAARACEKHRHHRTGFSHGKERGTPAKADRKKSGKNSAKKSSNKSAKKPGKKPDRKKSKATKGGWKHADASRAKVRAVIIRRSKQIGVDPNLALAISWYESGWQQRRVSSAGALGAMQVMPATGRWLSDVHDRPFRLRNLYGNVTAGVTLIDMLRAEARTKHAVAGYYQGLAGVRRHGMYPSTKRYVDGVLTLKRRLAGGWNPA